MLGGQEARKPRSQEARQPASQGARQPRSQAARQPGSHAARESRSQMTSGVLIPWVLGLKTVFQGRRHEALADEIHVRMPAIRPDGCFCSAANSTQLILF